MVGTIAGHSRCGVLATGTVSAASHAVFPDPRVATRPATRGRALRDRETASWVDLRATLVVMPVFVLELINACFYLAAIMKTVALGQQAGETDARSAGRELVGSTLMGAWIALRCGSASRLRPACGCWCCG